MEDGIPLRPIGVFNPNALINVNMAGAERIEILRGPSSAMNGGNAVAGSINFISTRPTAVPDATFVEITTGTQGPIFQAQRSEAKPVSPSVDM